MIPEEIRKLSSETVEKLIVLIYLILNVFTSQNIQDFSSSGSLDLKADYDTRKRGVSPKI